MIIRSLLFNIFYITWTLSYALITSPLLLFSVDISLKSARIWAYVTLKVLKLLCNIDYKIHNHHLIENKPCLTISKHQSAWETLAFYLIVSKPTFILKKELLLIPFFGWHLKGLKMIAIDRKAGVRSIKKIIDDSKEAFKNGRQIVIFPEGTRTPYGEIAKINSGAYAIYKGSELPTFAIALDSGKCWPKNSFIKKPGTINVTIHPQLPNNLSKEDFELKVTELINKVD